MAASRFVQCCVPIHRLIQRECRRVLPFEFGQGNIRCIEQGGHGKFGQTHTIFFAKAGAHVSSSTRLVARFQPHFLRVLDLRSTISERTEARRCVEGRHALIGIGKRGIVANDLFQS